MKKARELQVRDMYTVFAEMFEVRAKRFRLDRPSPEQCVRMLNETIMVLYGYAEGLDELIQNARANARHEALPKCTPIRITRESHLQ
jgi:hypothetical protein